MQVVIRFLKLFLCMIFFICQAEAQLPPFGANQSMASGSEYFAGRVEGKPLIKLNLVGGVRLPGVYHVPIDTNLAEILSYAGGTVDGAQLDEIHVRSLLGLKSNFRTYDFSELSKGSSGFPIMSQGDIIQIDVTKDQLARTALIVTIVGSVISVVLATLAYQRSK